MKKQILAAGILFSGLASAQVPPYTITAFDSSSTGYYFMMPAAIFMGHSIPHDQIILDRKGELVYYRPFISTNTPGFTVQPNGLISYFQGNQYTLLDSTFVNVDTAKCVLYTTDSHELQILPNGNTLLLGVEVVTTDLSSYNMFSHNGSPGSPNAQLRSNVIQELNPAGNVVFEWHARNHFTFDDVDENWLNSPTDVDWTHSNALELDDDGNILLSSRHFNEITKINRSDSSIMWRLGGKRNEFTFINDTIPFCGQHDIRRVANGNVTLYDNGWLSTSGTPHFARALEYTLDETAKTATLAWSYVYDSTMYSKATGNMQRLPNGNTLINYGQINSKNVTFVVVDSLGSKVFEIAFADTCFSYRAFNFQSLPWSFHRPEITCIDSGGTFYLDAGAGHTTYGWNTGANTRFIPITVADTYYVFVPYGTGGYIRSESFIVDSVNNPCGFTSLVQSTMWQDGLLLSPSPVSDRLTIHKMENITSPTVAEIYNAFGELWKQDKNVKGSIDVSMLPPGLYVIRLTGNGRTVTGKFLKE